jgi:curli biogenesis system outer membrane secretion channel CsgG
MVQISRAGLGLLATGLVLSCHGGSVGGVTPRHVAEADSAAREAVANERALDAATLEPRAVGVTPFNVRAADTSLVALGYGLADLLITDLSRSGELQLVDRLRLDAILREIKLVESGRVDSSSAPRVGKLIRARRLVLGTLTQEPRGTLRIDARVGDVATGEIRAAVRGSARLEDILEAEKTVAFELFDQLGVSLTPAERAAVEQRPTRNIGALLAYSRGVRFQVEGQYAAAAAEFRSAVQQDPGFQAAATRLEEVEAASELEGPQPQVQASAEADQVDRAANVAIERVNGIFYSPLGGQQLGGIGDPAFPSTQATIVIIIETPP